MRKAPGAAIVEPREILLFIGKDPLTSRGRAGRNLYSKRMRRPLPSCIQISAKFKRATGRGGNPPAPRSCPTAAQQGFTHSAKLPCV